MIDLQDRIRRGREAIQKAQAEGKDVSSWKEHLQELEAELGRQAEAVEITRLMQSQGWALVWSDTLGEAIAFAHDEAAAAQVPAGIVTYTRSELEAIVGKGHDPDMLRLVHEAKKLGAKVASRDKASG